MHYRDGTPARVGDHVRGKGFNVRAGGWQAKSSDPIIEISGVVIATNPHGGTCNLTIAHAMPQMSFPAMCVQLAAEYGDAASFDYVGPRNDDRFAAP